MQKHERRLMMLKLGSVLVMLSVSSGCQISQPSDNALADALDAPLRRCAGALAGENMPQARAACLPVVAIYQASTGVAK
jgi:hypothetical protein